MHKAGKILLAIGVIICIIGGVLFVGSADLVEYDIEDDNVYEGTSGTFEYPDDDIWIVYIKDDVDCESFTATFTNTSSGETSIETWGDYFDKDDPCDDGSDDSDGFQSVGSVNLFADAGTYEVDASSKIYIMPIGAELGEAVAGILGAGISIGILCCGGFFLLLGLILGLTLKTPEPVVVIAAGAAPMVGTMPVMGAQPAMAAAPMAAAPMAAAPVAAPDPAQEYYNGLVAQGYDAATATQHTQQHYPGFQG